MIANLIAVVRRDGVNVLDRLAVSTALKDELLMDIMYLRDLATEEVVFCLRIGKEGLQGSTRGENITPTGFLRSTGEEASAEFLRDRPRD